MIPLEVRVKPISALPDGLGKGPPICSDHPPPMSENLPACKYWHDAAATGGAALNRKETAGRKESHNLPTHQTTCLRSPKAKRWQRRLIRKTSDLGAGWEMNQLRVPGTNLYLILRGWGAPQQVSPDLVPEHLYFLWPCLSTLPLLLFR